MGKNEIYWGIFSGAILLSHTIRRTRKLCLKDYREFCGIHFGSEVLSPLEKCKKIIINEYSRND